jgi:hypothetical protein
MSAKGETGNKKPGPSAARKTSSYVQDCWSVWRTAVLAALKKSPKFYIGTYAHRKALEQTFKLQQWMAKVATCNGPAYLASAMKSFAADARLAAINRTMLPRSIFRSTLIGPLAGILRRRDALTQLSYIGRALPKGRVEREGKIALQAHYEAYSSQPAKLSPDRLDHLTVFARNWAEKHLKAWSPKLEFEPSAGACLESGRKNGGLGGYLHKRMMEANGLSKEPFITSEDLRNWSNKSPEVRALFIATGQAEGFPVTAEEKKLAEALTDDPRVRRAQAIRSDARNLRKKITAYPAVEDEVAITAHANLRELLVKEFEELTNEVLPQAVATVVCERGNKVRIVTKSPGSMVALLHQYRLWMQQGMATDPRIKEVLEGGHREAVEDMFRHVRPEKEGILHSRLECMSADLKNATDLILMEVF